jgi:transposase
MPRKTPQAGETKAKPAAGRKGRPRPAAAPVPPAAPEPKGGRPTKATPDARAVVVDALEQGNTLACAAALAGVGVRTVHTWIRKGKGLGPDDPDPEGFRQFRQSVCRAQAEAESRRVGCVTSAIADGEWKAAQWWLQCRRPADWGTGRVELKAMRDELALVRQKLEALEELKRGVADGPPPAPPEGETDRPADGPAGGG